MGGAEGWLGQERVKYAAEEMDPFLAHATRTGTVHACQMP